MSIELNNADHPARQAAREIIERVVEPLLGRGISGEGYYDLEDRITGIVADVEPPKEYRRICAFFGCGNPAEENDEYCLFH